MVTATISLICAAGCNDAVSLEIASDRPVPSAIDAICVGVADSSGHGGQFGHNYSVDSLPQTLRIEPGSASSAWAWVRGDRGGVPAATAAAHVSFGKDLRLALDKCVAGRGSDPAVRGDPAGPAGARLAASQGTGGTFVVAVAAGSSAIVDAIDGGLVTGTAPAPPAGSIIDVIAIDVDGDCDDDLIVATTGAPPELWRRDGVDLVDAGPIGTVPVSALAAADVDRDGDIDLVVASGGTLLLYRNDGGGTFAADPAALDAGSRLTAASALALGDLDGDGNPDLVVGQAGGSLVAWLGSDGGGFQPSDAAVPAVPLNVSRLALVDADGDFDPDLVVAVSGAPMRLYVDRDGRLEDQSFVRLPQPAPIANAIAIGGWDDGCEPDAVIAATAGAPTLRGQDGGVLANDAMAPPGTDVVMADIDDDGVLDALIATDQGVVWLAR